jgi:hypothetical protein
MQRMSPEQRMDYRDAHYQRLCDVAREAGIELPETPPWKMTPGQRAEAQARQMEAARARMESMPAPAYGPASGFDAYPAPDFGPGWGPYGPGPWGPYPYY